MYNDNHNDIYIYIYIYILVIKIKKKRKKSIDILKLEGKILIENKCFFQSLKIGSPSALMFTIIKESHLPLIKYLNHHIEKIFRKKSDQYRSH